MGIVPYSPLARGVLTGKYAPGQAPAGDSRAGRKDKRMMETEFREESLQMAQKINATTITLPTCHLAMVQEPRRVEEFIEQAATSFDGR